MKKLTVLLLFAASLLPQTMLAQDKELFNHWSAGYSLGTDGLIGFDVATTIGHYVQARVGFSIMPQFKYTTDVDIESQKVGAPDKVDVTGKLHKSDFKILFDVYPSRNSSFRFTAGAFIGGSKLIKVKNKNEGELLGLVDPGDGFLIGDHLISIDPNGNAEASIKVGSFKPYLGIGFGRAVPQKSRVSVMFDLGVQFWGSPGVYSHGYYDEFNVWQDVDKKVKSSDLNGEDGGVIKTISKISVWPVLSLRIGGRFF